MIAITGRKKKKGALKRWALETNKLLIKLQWREKSLIFCSHVRHFYVLLISRFLCTDKDLLSYQHLIFIPNLYYLTRGCQLVKWLLAGAKIILFSAAFPLLLSFFFLSLSKRREEQIVFLFVMAKWMSSCSETNPGFIGEYSIIIPLVYLRVCNNGRSVQRGGFNQASTTVDVAPR